MLTAATKTGTSASFVYDGKLRQIQKTVGSTKTKYIYSGSHMMEERNGATNALTRRYVFAGSEEPVLQMTSAGVVTYIHHDHHGSVIAQSNASTGAVGNKYKYGPFGESAATLTGTTIGYTGQRYDTELGLYHYKARYFHPGIGRFLQPDPVGYKAGMNLYAYCSNDGLNHTDPDGLEPKEPVDILVKTWKSGKTSLFINRNAFKDAIGAVGISTEYIGSTLKPGLQSAMAMSERHLHDIRKVAGTALNPNAIKEVVFPVKLGENVHQVEQAGKVAMEKAKLAITNMRNPGKSLEPLGKAIGRSFSIIEKANPVILQFDLIEPLLREQF